MRRGVFGMPWAVGALLANLLLSGCQAEETPPAGPSPSASSGSPSASPASTSPSPSASPSSEIPAAAREKSETGAKVFARFYIEQSARAWTTPDPSLLDGLATDNCETCKSLVATARELAQLGRRYDRAPIKVGEIETFRGSGHEWVFETELEEQNVNVIDANGKV